MEFTTLKIAGGDAIQLLKEHRARYPASGQYPFLIGGDARELQLIKESAQFKEQDPVAIIQGSLGVKVAEWIARRKEADEYEFSAGEILGTWPGEAAEKGSIGLHKDLLSGKIKPEVYLGLARIEKPWHLPAILNYGNWNACPEPAIHCAFHREWQERYGAEITGISFDIVECVVSRPRQNKKQR